MKKWVFIVLIFVCLTGCGTTNEQGKVREIEPILTSDSPAKLGITENSIATDAKNKIITYDEINEVIAVHHDKDLLVGFNVRKMEEFNVMEIEKRVNKQLKKEFPHENVTVSHDQKILIELRKLIDEENSLSNKEIKKRIEKIKKLSKEKT